MKSFKASVSNDLQDLLLLNKKYNRFSMGPSEPVSYTHLDVYKRQFKKLFSQCYRYLSIEKRHVSGNKPIIK